MPPFNFGQVTGQAFQQSFQATQDREQQAKRQRALQRLRQRRLEQQARQARKRREQNQEQFEARQDFREEKFDAAQRQRAADSMQQMFQNVQEQRRFEQTTTPFSEISGVEGEGRVQNSLLAQAQLQQRGSGVGQGQMDLDDRRKFMDSKATEFLFRAQSQLPTQPLQVPEDGAPDPEKLGTRRDQVLQAAQQAVLAGKIIPRLAPERRGAMRKQVGKVLQSVDERLSGILNASNKGFQQGRSRVETDVDQDNLTTQKSLLPVGAGFEVSRDNPVTNFFEGVGEKLGLRQPDLSTEEAQELAKRSRRLQKVRDQTRSQMQPFLRVRNAVGGAEEENFESLGRRKIFSELFTDDQGRFSTEKINDLTTEQQIQLFRSMNN